MHQLLSEIKHGKVIEHDFLVFMRDLHIKPKDFSRYTKLFCTYHKDTIWFHEGNLYSVAYSHSHSTILPISVVQEQVKEGRIIESRFNHRVFAIVAILVVLLIPEKYISGVEIWLFAGLIAYMLLDQKWLYRIRVLIGI